MQHAASASRIARTVRNLALRPTAEHLAQAMTLRAGAGGRSSLSAVSVFSSPSRRLAAASRCPLLSSQLVRVCSWRGPPPLLAAQLASLDYRPNPCPAGAPCRSRRFLSSRAGSPGGLAPICRDAEGDDQLSPATWTPSRHRANESGASRRRPSSAVSCVRVAVTSRPTALLPVA
jgi:hypothetical protein